MDIVSYVAKALQYMEDNLEGEIWIPITKKK